VTLLLTAGGAALTVAVLAAGSLWRLLARRDHRCVVGSLRRGCRACTDALLGGHVLCACGAASAHLHGTALLAWRAEHQGERFPGAPRPTPVAVPEDEAGGRVLAAIEAEDESIRRAVVRARRTPDPRTPQVLREAARERDADNVNKD
jgi:hypothetical protein